MAPADAPRQTRQRTAIRALLAEAGDFRSAQQIHDDLRHAGSTVGLATVYRTLQGMAEAGDVDALRGPDGELSYRQCSTGHHHHLVCRRCGTAVEFTSREMETWVGEVAARHGFTEVDHELEVFGLCRDCSASSGGRVSAPGASGT